MELVTAPRRAHLELEWPNLTPGCVQSAPKSGSHVCSVRSPGLAALDELGVGGKLDGALLLGLGGRRRREDQKERGTAHAVTRP